VRNIFIGLVFTTLIVSANTLIVDNDPECSMSFFGSCLQWKDCTGGRNFKTTIKDALDHANDGDIIKICPSEYKEDDLTIDNSNLTIQSTSGKRDDVNITNKGLQSKKNIFRLPDYVKNLKIQNLSIYQYRSSHSGIYSSTYIKDINFTNLYIYSKGRGIYESDSIENVEFKLLDIKSSKEAIYLKGINKEIHLQDFNISVDGDYSAIKLTNWGDITIDTDKHELNYLQSAKYGLDIEKGNLLVKNSKLKTDKISLYLKKDMGDFKLYNSNINTKGRAIYAVKISQDANISHNTITINNSDNDGIYLKTVSGKTYIYNNTIENGNYGIRINDSSSGGEIKNNIIKNASKYGLKLLSSDKWRSFKVIHNCFENGENKNIYSKDKDGVFDDGSRGNYWDDWSGNGAYKVPSIPKYDNYPLSTCDINANSDDHLIVNYRMDSCSWDGKSGDVKDSSSKGNDASSGNDANTTDGKLCRGGDLNATATADKYILAQDGISLPKVYSLTLWVKFPLNEDGHKTFRNGRNSYQYFNIADLSGSDNDYIYFLKNQKNDWSLCIAGSDDSECKSYNPQNLSGWHQLVFSVTDKGTKFYVDADKKLDFDQHANSVTLGLLFNSDYKASSDNSPNEQSIGAIVDEFKIFSKELTSKEVSTIYDNENSGKNYDGETRSCNNCSGGGVITGSKSQFDSWDIFRNIDDRNISTKIVAKKFALLVASLNKSGTDYQEFNGTVCVKIIDKNNNDLSDWKKIYFNDKNSSDQTQDGNPDFNVTKSLKEGLLKISWKSLVDEDCPLDNEDNETNSTDDFAIRPEAYHIVVPSKTLYAGEDFNVTFEALDGDDNNATDYNESNGSSFVIDVNEIKQGCVTGTYSGDVTFQNGGNTTIANYNEVGDINITVHEVNGSEFAKVDEDDTNDSARLIAPYSATFTNIQPYDINVTKVDFSISNGSFWLYTDRNISDNNITLNMTIDAYNKQGDKLQDFNSTCYAKDLNLTFYYDVNITDNNVSDINLTLDGNLTSNNQSISDINKTVQIPKELFVSGEANSSYAFGVDRNYTQPLSPIFIALQKVDINNTDLSKNEGNFTATADQNATFYYGRVIGEDLTTSHASDTAYETVVVYSQSKNKYVDQNHEELINWYRNDKHNDDKYGKVKSSRITASTLKGDEEISSSVSAAANNAQYKIDVNNSNNKVGNYFIHLDISPWLWYVPAGFGSDYNDTNGSSCLEHPCLKYRYEKDGDNSNRVQSGNFNGVDFDSNVSKNSRGVRILR
jgi:hypothetical protein